MLRIFFISVLIFLGLGSCVKDVPGVEETNTNIFDPDYAGEQWFEVIDTYKFFNSVGQQRVKFEVKIPEDNFPGLRPTAVTVACRLAGQDFETFPIYLNLFGEYEFERNYVPNVDDVYCIEIGLINDADSSIINTFTECVTL